MNPTSRGARPRNYALRKIVAACRLMIHLIANQHTGQSK